jgi:hypothetical protein
MAKPIPAKQINTGSPVDIGSENLEGSSSAIARADHVHKMSLEASSDVLKTKLMGFGVEAYSFVTSAASSDSGLALLKLVIDSSFTKKLGGNASQEGLVSSPPVNQVQVRERSTGDPLETDNNEQVYGRLTHTDVPLVAGVYMWDGTTTVAASADPSGELAAGEFIRLDSDGQLFEVLTVSPTQVVIANPGSKAIPSGDTGSSKASVTLSYFYADSSAAQQPYTFASPVTVDIGFVESISLQDAPFGALQSEASFSEVLPASHNHDTLYPRRDDLTAKGDIYARSAADVSRLPVGSDGQVLVADSVEATGLRWAGTRELGTIGFLIFKEDGGLVYTTDGNLAIKESDL